MRLFIRQATVFMISLGLFSLLSQVSGQRLESDDQQAISILRVPKVPVDQLEATDAQARRQADAAISLYSKGRQDRFWPLLRSSSDQSVRSYIIRDLGRLGAFPDAIIRRLVDEIDPSIRRALILSLGEFRTSDIIAQKRKTLRTAYTRRTARQCGLPHCPNDFKTSAPLNKTRLSD